MLYFSRWKALAIILTALVVCLCAVPNFFPEATVKTWPKWAQRHLVLGLDLQGGSHILLEVDTNAVLSGQLKQPVGAYLDRLYYDTAGFEPGYLSFAATIIPPEHLMFGTDAPFPLVLADPIGFVRKALPGPMGEAALGPNFQRLIQGRS